jgi:hypothetical protein
MCMRHSVDSRCEEVEREINRGGWGMRERTNYAKDGVRRGREESERVEAHIA